VTLEASPYSTVYRISRAWPWPYPAGGLCSFIPASYPYDEVITVFRKAIKQLPEGTTLGKSNNDWTLLPHIVVDFTLVSTGSKAYQEVGGKLYAYARNSDNRVLKPEQLPEHLLDMFEACRNVIRDAWAEAAELVGSTASNPS
jgi:hypothetical protein